MGSLPGEVGETELLHLEFQLMLFFYIQRRDLSLGVFINFPPSLWWFEEDPGMLMVTLLIKIEEVKADPAPRALGRSWVAPRVER